MLVDGDGKRAAPGAGTRAASPDHRAVAQRLGMTRVKRGGLPAQALVEDVLGHGCWGVIPVGHGLGRLVPERGATCAGYSGWGGGHAQVDEDGLERWGAGDKSDDAHLRTAERAAQREDLVDAGEQQRPEDARRGALGGLRGIASWQRCAGGRGCRPRQGSHLWALRRCQAHCGQDPAVDIRPTAQVRSAIAGS